MDIDDEKIGENGMIGNPKGKAKPVAFGDVGLAEGERLVGKLRRVQVRGFC